MHHDRFTVKLSIDHIKHYKKDLLQQALNDFFEKVKMENVWIELGTDIIKHVDKANLLERVLRIEPNNICGFINMVEQDKATNDIFATVYPYGPKGQILQQYLEGNNQDMQLVVRAITGNGLCSINKEEIPISKEESFLKIITFDLVHKLKN